MKLTQATKISNLHSIYARGIGFVILLSICSTMASANGDIQFGYSLTVSPERCVALRQGQTCYQEVKFIWSSPDKGSYCLTQLATNVVLRCWENTISGTFEMDFQAHESGEFVLRKSASAEDLSRAIVTVSWVFKSSKRPKSSWKLF